MNSINKSQSEFENPRKLDYYIFSWTLEIMNQKNHLLMVPVSKKYTTTGVYLMNIFPRKDLKNSFLTIYKVLRKSSEKLIEELSEELKQKVFINEKEKNPLRCRICKNKITLPDNMTEVNGQHKHTFKNPSGIVYQIGCFLSANGCITIGIPTTDYTWFSGFSWSLALCSQCFAHLGWFYQSGDSSFFGLILENLIEDSTTH